MWPFLDTPASFIQFAMFVLCVPVGRSHIVRPGLWVDFFTRVHAQGTA